MALFPLSTTNRRKVWSLRTIVVAVTEVAISFTVITSLGALMGIVSNYPSKQSARASLVLLATVGLSGWVLRKDQETVERARESRNPTQSRIPREPLKELITPEACIGCKHYHGKVYRGEKGANPFICAMHPDGYEGNSCPDWEELLYAYTFVCVHGMGSGTMPYFYFTRTGFFLSELAKDAIEIDTNHNLTTFRQGLGLKSSNDLAGVKFMSACQDINEAFDELLDSCKP